MQRRQPLELHLMQLWLLVSLRRFHLDLPTILPVMVKLTKEMVNKIATKEDNLVALVPPMVRWYWWQLW